MRKLRRVGISRSAARILAVEVFFEELVVKVILNVDVRYLGEEGDVKNVASGYARNYLFPRGLAVPCNPTTMAFFEERKAEIEERKNAKRQNSASTKERLEGTEWTVVVTAGPNGKLYGAVSATTLAGMLANNGFEIERKKIELQGNSIKTVGKYSAVVHLYEAEIATITFHVKTQEMIDAETAAAKAAAEKAAKEAEKAASQPANPDEADSASK